LKTKKKISAQPGQPGLCT